MNLCKSDKQGIRQRFTADWKKRNLVTDIFLYGIQVGVLLCSLVMAAEITDMVRHFCDPYPLSRYEGMTVGGLIFRMLSKGWLVGLVSCIVIFFCNRRVIRWKADGILWMFILFFGISISTLAVDDEMFLYFSVFSIGSMALYFLSSFLPKRIDEANTTTFRQCRKPSNLLTTLSFVVMILWSILLCDAVI